MLSQQCRVAAQPINWINDDFRDLGADISLEQCLREMKDAGYAGTELGHRFPSDADELHALLGRHGLSLASAWHSTFLADSAYELELEKFVRHADKLKHCGSDVVIVCECTEAIHGDGTKPLRFQSGRDLLSDGQWARVYHGLDKLSAHAERIGMKVAYHPHMGTAVQDRDDIDRLMKSTSRLSLLLDTGHITFAGDDACAVASDHAARIAHVHTKDVRRAVASRARAEAWSFERAVRAGVFTVPGDGDIDYLPIFDVLAHASYRGWLVVEAEQDPARAHPFTYASRGRAYLKTSAGV